MTTHAPEIEPDRDAMRRHVELVFGGGFDGALDGLVELAWTDPVTGSLRNAQLFGIDQLEELVDRAAELNRIERCNVYVGAALRKPETPPAKRTADTDFHSAPFAWADIDLDRVDAAVRMMKAAGMPATMTVVTGRHPHTRAQFWWRLVDAERDGAAIKALCAQLALALGGDSTVSNPGRVLRLGGSIAWSLKPGRIVEATEVHIPADDRPPAYWASALAQAFAAPAPLLQAAPASSEPSASPDAPAPSKPKPLDLPIGSLSVEATLAAIQRNDHWYHNAVRLVGNWVARGLSNAEILAFAPALTIGSASDGRSYTVDQTRLDLNAMITGARRKWNLPNPAVTIEDKLPPPPIEIEWEDGASANCACALWARAIVVSCGEGGSAERVGRGIVQDDWDHRRLQAGSTFDQKIDRTRRFGLDPVTEAAQRAVGGNRRADAGAEGIERGITGGALHNRLDLSAVLIVVAQRRKRDPGLARLAVTKDQEASRGYTLW